MIFSCEVPLNIKEFIHSLSSFFVIVFNYQLEAFFFIAGKLAVVVYKCCLIFIEIIWLYRLYDPIDIAVTDEIIDRSVKEIRNAYKGVDIGFDIVVFIFVY